MQYTSTKDQYSWQSMVKVCICEKKKPLVASAKEVMFCQHLFVCLSICYQHYWKSYERICTIFPDSRNNDTRNNHVNFDTDTGHHAACPIEILFIPQTMIGFLCTFQDCSAKKPGKTDYIVGEILVNMMTPHIRNLISMGVMGCFGRGLHSLNVLAFSVFILPVCFCQIGLGIDSFTTLQARRNKYQWKSVAMHWNFVRFGILNSLCDESNWVCYNTDQVGIKTKSWKSFG